MVKFDWLKEILTKVVWKFAMGVSSTQSVTTFGMNRRHRLFAGNWDTMLPSVRRIANSLFLLLFA